MERRSAFPTNGTRCYFPVGYGSVKMLALQVLGCKSRAYGGRGDPAPTGKLQHIAGLELPSVPR